MFAVGALPTGVAGWWIGSRVGISSLAALALVALFSVLASLAGSLLTWRWFVSPLRELERGLERWTRGDLSTPLDDGRMTGWRRLAGQFDRAQSDLQAALDEAKAEVARERTRLQTLIEKIPDALIMTNMRGDVQYLNAPAMPLIGAKPEDVRAGGRALFSPLQPERWRLEVQDILKKHTLGHFFERVAPDETVSTYRTFVTMFNDISSGDFGVLVTLRDVTAERRLDALKEEFFQSAAHDLRAPLFGIQGYLRLLRKSMMPDERQSSYFEAIEQSSDKLTLFVKDALDAARIENGHLRLNPAPVDPAGLVTRTRRLFQPLADERGIALDVKLSAELPKTFSADERLIERLLHNLVGNALKFTPRGGSVILSAGTWGNQLELVVEDDGPGIPESQRALVFEKFRQLEGGSPKSGFGLGLSICAKIVKLHHGVIWVEAGKIQGSRFIARLPLTHGAKETV
jgi:two-component system sensor histidine kinase VicK